MFTAKQFHYFLPDDRIAQEPMVPRDHSRLMVLDRESGEIEHHHFYDLPDLLQPGDVLVRNNTKVIPARLYGVKDTGGKCEVLLVKQVRFSDGGCVWECLTKPGLKLDQQVRFSDDLVATCVQVNDFTRDLEFAVSPDRFFEVLNKIGHTPIPPYIEWNEDDEQHMREVYQTVFAKLSGSVAAPTAGLHFTPELDEKLKAKGVEIEEVTLHVGLGTFLPVQQEQIDQKILHKEWFQLSSEVAERLNAAKAAGRRIISVGTTTTRVLETCATQNGKLAPQTGETTLFIQPGFNFSVIDGMITNFHLPESSLLMLVSALVSQPNTSHPFTTFAESSIGQAYELAVKEKYRFFSFGDAMFIH